MEPPLTPSTSWGGGVTASVPVLLAYTVSPQGQGWWSVPAVSQCPAMDGMTQMFLRV